MLVLALLVWSGAALHGQVFPKEQERLGWHGNRIIRITSTVRLSVEVPGAKGSFEVPLGPQLYWPYKMDIADGAVWVCVPEQSSQKQDILRLYRSPDGLRRESEAWVPLKLPEGRVYGLYPLPQDRFLLVARDLFRREREVSFLALGRRDEQQKVTLERLIPVDLGERALEGAESEGFEKDIRRSLYLGGFITRRVRGTGSLVFANGASARMLVLDLESLNTKLVRVFPGIPDKAYWTGDSFHYEYALLGLQPRRDGHFTLATRSQQAVLEARKTELALEMNQIKPPPGATAEQVKAFIRAERENPARAGSRKAFENDGTLRFPEILWWDLDPVTGTLVQMAPPPGAPLQITTAAELRDFRFRVTAKDEIKIGD